MGINSNELVQHIEQLNKQVAQLNSERQRQLGQLEVTKKQFETYIENYKTVYGVQLTAENLASEYNKVLEETNKAAQDLEKQIQYIQSGAYKQEKPVVQSVQGVSTPNIPAPTSSGFNGFADANKVEEELPFDPDPPKDTSSAFSGSPLDAAVRAAINANTTQAVNTAPVQPMGGQTAQAVNTTPVQGNVTPAQPTQAVNTTPVQPNIIPSGFGTTSVPPTASQVVTPTVSDTQANVDKPITPVGWGTPAPQVSGEQINSQLANMFGTKFGE